jgi:predicted nucleic acid-binding protein
MTPIADSGYVVALLNRSDPAHQQVAAVARSLRVAPWLPVPAVTEICHVVHRDMGARAVTAFVRRLAEPDAGLVLLDPAPQDYLRAAEVLDRYGDSGLDLVDALIVALAERLGVRTLLTLNRRHLGLVQPRHCPAFELLPE